MAGSSPPLPSRLSVSLSHTVDVPVPKNEYLTGNVANTLAEQPLQCKGEHIHGGMTAGQCCSLPLKLQFQKKSSRGLAQRP